MQRFVRGSLPLFRVNCFATSRVSLRSYCDTNKQNDTSSNEAEKQHIANDNDHRILGKKQELFMSHPYSAGSPFFLPHGVKIYSRLQQYLSKQYRLRGYQEVMTPNIFLKELWETSG